ncbi:3-oxoacid CoA-transferase subunit A [Acinetobacter sp. ANC 3832]|uniref:3-oxoacid CoA-transferase subunit A n=1 Tax=Acinetobacter sp. ANC 3832 TaxID=1977874 RepID=UPI000A34DA41|nr:3-oxoacid CoA-transferase subunit A [Acinetobacter sp. ANC 3832]OTG91194.1 3-oxoadipate CoA-transferase [Acinetobacter sp. ANC 3832]
MIDKTSALLMEALSQIKDGSTIMISGFGTAGQPAELIYGLVELGLKDLVIINNNASNGEYGLAQLLKAGAVRKLICSFPRQADSYIFDELYRAGKIELELVPQGNLACRIQATGMGLGPIYTPTGFGTLLAEGKPTLNYEGKDFVLENPIHADFALIKAQQGDRWGNLVYRKAARNFGPIMAMAADCTIAQVSEVIELGQLDPEHIITPGIFVQHVIQVTPEQSSALEILK